MAIASPPMISDLTAETFLNTNYVPSDYLEIQNAVKSSPPHQHRNLKTSVALQATPF